MIRSAMVNPCSRCEGYIHSLWAFATIAVNAEATETACQTWKGDETARKRSTLILP